MTYLGVVPARGGSKGLPGKNLALCDGRPLLAYAAEAALACGKLDRVVLSTDSEEIAEAGRRLGLEVPFLRPAELARDDTPILPVLEHLLAQPSVGERAPGALVLLQPTSPLRTARHLEEAIALFESSGADSLVSVQPVPHVFERDSQMEMREGWLTRVAPGDAPILRRQDKPPRFARNGPAIVITSAGNIRAGRLYGPRLAGYRMSELESVDVDGPGDLLLAELLLQARRRDPAAFR
jgi:CMP-N-acetylneuraminic acid synthetase